MDVDTNYSFLKFLARKTQLANMPPSQYQFAYNTAQRQYYDNLLGHINDSKTSSLTPKESFGINSKISRNLSPFKVDEVSIATVSQIAAYPNNFQFLVLMKDTNGRKIERIDDAKLPARLVDAIDPITDTSKAFYVESALGWKIYPSSVTPIIINYYSVPIDVVWGFTIVSGRPVYNPSTSVQPIWDVLSNEDILGRAARILGISFSQQDLKNYGEEVIDRGE